MTKFIEGQRVQVLDGSNVHGELGKIDNIGLDGIIMIELSDGIMWPVVADEIKKKGKTLTVINQKNHEEFLK